MADPNFNNTTTTTTFAIMNGRVAHSSNRWEDITPPLVDGAQLVRTAKRSGITLLETIRDVANLAAAEALVLVYVGLVGKTVDILDQFGTAWTHPDGTPSRAFAVLNVSTQKIDAIAKVGGVSSGGGPFVVSARWELRYLVAS